MITRTNSSRVSSSKRVTTPALAPAPNEPKDSEDEDDERASSMDVDLTYPEGADKEIESDAELSESRGLSPTGESDLPADNDKIQEKIQVALTLSAGNVNGLAQRILRDTNSPQKILWWIRQGLENRVEYLRERQLREAVQAALDNQIGVREIADEAMNDQEQAMARVEQELNAEVKLRLKAEQENLSLLKELRRTAVEEIEKMDSERQEGGEVPQEMQYLRSELEESKRRGEEANSRLAAAEYRWGRLVEEYDSARSATIATMSLVKGLDETFGREAPFTNNEHPAMTRFRESLHAVAITISELADRISTAPDKNLFRNENSEDIM